MSAFVMLHVASGSSTLDLAEVVRGRSAVIGEEPILPLKVTQANIVPKRHVINTADVSDHLQQSCCTHTARTMSLGYEDRTSAMICEGRSRQKGKT